MADQPLTIDPWSSLSYKAALPDDDRIVPGAVQARWMSERDRRRLSAYMVLAAYVENVARDLPSTEAEEERTERREYGDPSLLVEQALSHLLGESQDIVVAGADAYDPEAAETVDGDGAPTDDGRAEWEAQERLRKWAIDENFALALLDGERKCIELGDVVWLLEWDARKQRPRLAVLDPGLYFPVLSDDLTGDDYPERVHLAWEIPGEEFPDGKPRVRRVTYTLAPIAPDWDEVTGEVTLRPGDTWNETDGVIERVYPWNDGEPSTTTCYLTDATWVLSTANSGPLDRLTLDEAEFRLDDEGRPIRDLDLGIDFVPIIHQPNTVAGQDHFGQSLLAKVTQVIDDLQQADTDAEAASATTGTPMIGLTETAQNAAIGGRDEGLVVRPGQIFRLGPDGRLFTVDTSSQLAEMRNRVSDLFDRMSRNVRIPDVALGSVPATTNMSGLAIQLRYGPLSALVRSMRLARAPKYRLLFKFVQRMLMLADDAPADTRVYPAELVLGPFLPKDETGTITAVREGVQGKVISLETGVRMLQAAGVPIEDIAEEVAAIESRMFKEAGELADATGDDAAVREFLGLAPAAPAAVPTRRGDGTVVVEVPDA